MWCSKILSSGSLCRGPALYPAKNEEIYGIVPYQKNFMSRYIRKLQHVGHKLVICGLHPDCSVGEMDQQVQPTFNSDTHHTYYSLKF